MAKDMDTGGLAIDRLGRRERRSWNGNAGKLRRETERVAGTRTLAG